MNCDAIALAEGLGNDLKLLAVHSYMPGSSEAQTLDLCATFGWSRGIRFQKRIGLGDDHATSRVVAFSRRHNVKSVLPSLHHPADQCSGGDANRKRRRNRQREISLEPLRGVIQKLFGGIATLLCGPPRYSDSIRDRIGNCTGCAGSLASCLADMFGRSFRYGL
jgi:hypothetical protein